MLARIVHETSMPTGDLDAVVAGVHAIGQQLYGVQGLEPVLQQTNLDEALPSLPTGQVDASAILSEFPAFATGELLVFATQRDLGHRSVNFLFGLSTVGKAIFSSHRVEGVALTGLVTHEIGHAFGLVNPEASNYNARSRFIGHCMNECVMTPVNTHAEMVQASQMIRERPRTSGFCDPCADTLRHTTISR